MTLFSSAKRSSIPPFTSHRDTPCRSELCSRSLWAAPCAAWANEFAPTALQAGRCVGLPYVRAAIAPWTEPGHPQNLWSELWKRCGQVAARPDRRSSGRSGRDSYSHAFFKRNSYLAETLEVLLQLSPRAVDNSVGKLWSPGQAPVSPGAGAGWSKISHSYPGCWPASGAAVGFEKILETLRARLRYAMTCPQSLWIKLLSNCG